MLITGSKGMCLPINCRMRCGESVATQIASWLAPYSTKVIKELHPNSQLI